MPLAESRICGLTCLKPTTAFIRIGGMAIRMPRSVASTRYSMCRIKFAIKSGRCSTLINSLILRRPPRPARPRAQQSFHPDEQKVGADGEQGGENRPGDGHGREVPGY